MIKILIKFQFHQTYTLIHSKTNLPGSQVSHFLKSIIICKVDENSENVENLNFTSNDGFPNVGHLGSPKLVSECIRVCF
jgi:hypothetical protein